MGVLDDNPGWLEALRARVLTREMLELPRIVSDLAGNTDQRFDRVDQRMDKFEQRMDRLENDMGVLRGAHARNAAIEYADDITDELGLDMVRVLRGAEIRTLARSKGTKDIPANDLRSFRVADLIIESRDGKGETCFVVVEVSFTANGRDTHRAIRNAGLMSRFTGKTRVSRCDGSQERRRYSACHRIRGHVLVSTGPRSFRGSVASISRDERPNRPPCGPPRRSGVWPPRSRPAACRQLPRRCRAPVPNSRWHRDAHPRARRPRETPHILPR